MTKVDLGKLVDLTPRRIASFENQGETPPASTIDALAAALAFPLQFFYGSSVNVPSTGSVSFRSLSRLPAGRRDAALAAAALAIELASWIDSRFDLPDPDLPDFENVDPTTAALAVRAAWGLGDRPAPNMVHLLEAHGVRVHALTDDCASLDGFSLWSDHVPFAFLSYHKSPERGRWDAAHELGHLVLHVDGSPQGREQEREADSFAAEFLLPGNGVLERSSRFVSMTEIRREKLFWRVSAMAMIRRLGELKVLTEWQYRTLVIEAAQMGLRRTEGDIEFETSQLIPKVLSLLRSEGVTMIEIAGDLNLPVAELRGLLLGQLAGLPGEGSPSGPKRPSHLHAL